MREINSVDECKFEKRWTEKVMNFLAKNRFTFPSGPLRLLAILVVYTDSHSSLDFY